MEMWMLVPAAILVIGVAVVVYGALRDRTRRQQAEALLTSPPARQIPGFTATRPPKYLLGPQARERTAPLPALPQEPVARRDGTELPYGFASAEFATHAGPIAVLDGPRVLVCTDPVTSVVEVLHALARFATDGGTAVLVTPEVSDEVATTLGVNVVQDKLAILVVPISDAGARDALAATVGATPIDVFDLHAGYVPTDHLGRARQWVSDNKRSWVLIDDRANG